MNFLNVKVVKEGEDILLVCDGAKLNIGKNEALGNYLDKEVILGIRPENVSLSSKDKRNHILGKIEVVEHLGAETLIYLKTTAGNIVSRVEPSFSTRIGEEIELYLNLDKIHLFDKETEKKI